VVGAGITGLVAAWELAQSGCDVTVLESERRPGGVIISERREGFVIEGGPDGFLAAEPEIPELAREVGLAKQLVGQSARGTFLWNGAALEPLAEGRAAALLGIDAGAADVAAGFRSFANGMGELVTTLAERLAGKLQFTQGVTGLAPTPVGWRVALTGGSAHDSEGVVLALPAYAGGRLLEAVGVSGARALGDVVYAPGVTVSLAYRADQVARPLDGTGFVSAPGVGVVRACTYASSKFPGRAPDGYVLLRAFLEPADGDSRMLAHGELAAILGIRGAPLWSRAFHWTRGLPRYPAHHAGRVAAVRARLRRLAPLAIAGAGFDGTGVSACVRSGREAARVVLGRLGG